MKILIFPNIRLIVSKTLRMSVILREHVLRPSVCLVESFALHFIQVYLF